MKASLQDTLLSNPNHEYTEEENEIIIDATDTEMTESTERVEE